MSTENGFRFTGSAAEGMSMRESLAQVIRGMTNNAALREDLLQEAMVHLWLTETRRPGQTRSWYLQSCRFHLQHYLNSGRSIDSAKRWRDQLPLMEHSAEEESGGEVGDSGNSVLTSVSAREIMSLLAPLLTPQEQAVLNCLADGLGPREIGRKMNLSHTMVIRHRRKIAELFSKLDLPTGTGAQPMRAIGLQNRNANRENSRKLLRAVGV
jgi:RNA polymerase sigma factor (sigma-70 family)